MPHLFAALERTLRETEFRVSQDARGHLCVELLPLHAGYREELLLGSCQPRDVRRDHRLHALGKDQRLAAAAR